MGLEGRGHYRVSCGVCGRAWPEVRTGFRQDGRYVVAVCGACREVKGVRLPRSRRQARAYLLDLIQAREKLVQSYEKGRERLEGMAGMAAGPRTAERLARLKPPETKGLDEAIERAQNELDGAPDKPDTPGCEACGKALAVCEEGLRGYSVPCPACDNPLSFTFVPPPR